MHQTLVCPVFFYPMQHSSDLPMIPFLERSDNSMERTQDTRLCSATYCAAFEHIASPLVVLVSPSINHKDDSEIIAESVIYSKISRTVDVSEVYLFSKEIVSSSVLSDLLFVLSS